MPANEIPEVALQINARFFDAVSCLVSDKKIRGLQTLARQWGVSRFALTWSKHHPEDKRIKIEYLYYIARDYNVSLMWLFFQEGEMFIK